ncbi:PAS domain-containing protein [Synoicihabitans lomoniglobus]|uniref:PAS domain-containing protein n=1 Tax=Synoicihabitans lomoniglobus TaxID=2909285 RepID=A0AAE9ZXX7_9BACT|nr:PAS domain-containing protein [Opitutaceae bacterium LMO-M01]WED63238.1 PAS domain-containing protein [Opitutaceae bacterium LMO-M01]
MQEFVAFEHDLAAGIVGNLTGLFGQMLDVVDDMIFVKDLDGAFVYNNAAHLAFLGIERDAARGKTDFDLFPATEAELFFAHDTRLLESERPVVSVHPARNEGGQPVLDVAFKSVARTTVGEIIGLVGIVKRVPVGAVTTDAAVRAQVSAIVTRTFSGSIEPTQLQALDQSVVAAMRQARELTA